MTPTLHVVIGAGQVGLPLARLLASQGQRVRLVRHSAGTAEPGMEVVRGDLGDAASLAEAVRGAAVIYHCAATPYFARLQAQWLPVWTEHLIAAAGREQARLVVMDNVYAFGMPSGGTLDEDAPYAPRSRKGEVRAQVARRLDQAHARGEARVVVGRASDFWGPGGTDTYFGDQFWPAVLAGRPARMLGNTEMPHTYHYIPDVAAGLAALGTAGDGVTGRWWMLPCQPPIATRELAERLAREAGVPLRLAPVGPAMMTVLGLFIRILPELREMLYQWERPFVMDDRRFRAAFPGVRPTSLEQALADTVAWARAHYGARVS